MFALFIPALMGALAATMASFVGRAIIALGIGFVTYKGMDVMITTLRSGVIDSMKGLPVAALNFAAYLYVDKCLSMIMSAVAIALSLRLVGGGVKRMIHK